MQLKVNMREKKKLLLKISRKCTKNSIKIINTNQKTNNK